MVVGRVAVLDRHTFHRGEVRCQTRRGTSGGPGLWSPRNRRRGATNRPTALPARIRHAWDKAGPHALRGAIARSHTAPVARNGIAARWRMRQVCGLYRLRCAAKNGAHPGVSAHGSSHGAAGRGPPKQARHQDKHAESLHTQCAEATGPGARTGSGSTVWSRQSHGAVASGHAGPPAIIAACKTGLRTTRPLEVCTPKAKRSAQRTAVPVQRALIRLAEKSGIPTCIRRAPWRRFGGEASVRESAAARGASSVNGGLAYATRSASADHPGGGFNS